MIKEMIAGIADDFISGSVEKMREMGESEESIECFTKTIEIYTRLIINCLVGDTKEDAEKEED